MVIDSDSVDIVIDSVTLSVKRGTADRPRCSNPSKWRTAFRFLCHCWKNSVNDEKYSVNATSAYTVCVFVCIRSSYIFCCTSLSCAGLRAPVHPCALHRRGLFPSLSNSAQAVPWVLGSSSLSLLSLNHPLLLLMMCFHLSVSSPLTLPPSSPCWFITANYQRWICLWNSNNSKDIFISFFFFGFVFVILIYLFFTFVSCIQLELNCEQKALGRWSSVRWKDLLSLHTHTNTHACWSKLLPGAIAPPDSCLLKLFFTGNVPGLQVTIVLKS